MEIQTTFNAREIFKKFGFSYKFLMDKYTKDETVTFSEFVYDKITQGIHPLDIFIEHGQDQTYYVNGLGHVYYLAIDPFGDNTILVSNEFGLSELNKNTKISKLEFLHSDQCSRIVDLLTSYRIYITD